MKRTLLATIILGLTFQVFAQNTYQFDRYIQATGREEGTLVSSDDAEQENQAMDKLYDDDLDSGWEGDDLNIMVTGMRFRDIYVPKGATITSAYIEVFAHEDESDEAKITIVGEDTDFAETYDLENLITDRTATTASVSWTVTENWTMWEQYQTADISPIIQEIIDRPGWKPGNPIAIMLKGEDQGANELDNARDMESFENEEDPEDGGDGKNHQLRRPRLVIQYTNANGLITSQIMKTGVEEGAFVSSDDAEQENQAMDKIYDDDLDAGWEGDDLNIMVTGMRFRDVRLTQGATIDSAWIEVYAHEDENDEARITIVGEATDNAQTYDLENLITDRPTTTASVDWTVTEPWTMWEKYRTADITPIIQEIVNRPGWSYWNSLAIMLKGEDQGANELDNARDMESFENEEDPEDGGDGENHPERAPRLIVYAKFTQPVQVEQEMIKKPASFVFPNPAVDGYIHVRTDDSNAVVNIYSMTGQMVKHIELKGGNQLDISDLNRGVYMIQLEEHANTAVQKLIVQ